MVKRIGQDPDLLAFDSIFGGQYAGDVLQLTKRDVILKAQRLRATGTPVSSKTLECAIWGLYQYQSFETRQSRLAA